MATKWQEAAAGLVHDLRSVFGDRLRSVVVYGPHLDGQETAPLDTLALVTSVGLDDLDACARHYDRWQHTGIATPLVLPEDEFRRSLDAFPLEYGEIIRAHVQVFGDDPFTDVSIQREDLRRACESQIKSHLVHMREGYIQTGGRPAAIARLVTASAPAFVALLRNVARLNGVSTNDRLETTLRGATATHLPEGIVRDILALEHATGVPTSDPARLFPEYLRTVEQLAQAVDRWREV